MPLPQGPLAMTGKVFDYHDLKKSEEEQASVIGIWWITVNDIAKHPAIYKMFPIPQQSIWPKKSVISKFGTLM